jgi:glycosyltransferase involved in cell wall biosynthesis
LKSAGLDVVLYSNGESTAAVETRWLYKNQKWPIGGEIFDSLQDFNHVSWAIADAAQDCDIIHLNSVPGLMFTRFAPASKFVYTVHHVYEPHLSEIYQFFPQVEFVTISDFQRQRESMQRMRTIHHGIDLNCYRLQNNKREYFSFLGRIAPIKGTHLAIEVAKKTGIPLKIAGEVQPIFRDYFDAEVKPHLDGKLIEYVGEADLEAKNELLGNSLAMLFPIQWNEPFGLVMIEAMACGAPVLALSGGSVEEVVRDGVSGFVCQSTDHMVRHAADMAGRFNPANIRQYCQQYFSVEKMVADYVKLYQNAVDEESPIGKSATRVPLVA